MSNAGEPIRIVVDRSWRCLASLPRSLLRGSPIQPKLLLLADQSEGQRQPVVRRYGPDRQLVLIAATWMLFVAPERKRAVQARIPFDELRVNDLREIQSRCLVKLSCENAHENSGCRTFTR